MNKVELIGRTTKEIELRHTLNGKAVTNFTLAVRRNENETDFIKVTAWGSLAEIAERYIRKGNQVAIVGRLQVREYEKDGQRRDNTEVVAEEIHLIGSRNDG